MVLTAIALRKKTFTCSAFRCVYLSYSWSASANLCWKLQSHFVFLARMGIGNNPIFSFRGLKLW